MNDNMDMPDETDEELASLLVPGPDFARTGEMEMETKKRGAIDNAPLFVIGPRERAHVLIFGRRYDLRRPDEGTAADTNAAKTLGQRISVLGSRKNPTASDLQNLTQATRELILLLVPEIDESTIKFLTLAECAGIASAWDTAYGQNRPG